MRLVFVRLGLACAMLSGGLVSIGTVRAAPACGFVAGADNLLAQIPGPVVGAPLDCGAPSDDGGTQQETSKGWLYAYPDGTAQFDADDGTTYYYNTDGSVDTEGAAGPQQPQPASDQNANGGFQWVGRGTPRDPNSFHIGDKVIVSTDGTDWAQSTVSALADPNDWTTANEVQTGGWYAPANVGGWHHYTAVFPATRDASWTSWFLGDWGTAIPAANYDTTSSTDQSVDISGSPRWWLNVASYGMKLPPMEIRQDGTYSWVQQDGSVISGTWIPRPDAPGVVLQNGPQGRNWTVVPNTTNKDINERHFEVALIYADPTNYFEMDRPAA